jgi:hypothetical protein
MWSNFFEAGGWGMYPTLIFGFLLVASSVLFVLRPERRFVPLLLSLGVLTLGSGLLSFSVGVVNTFRYLQRVEPAEQFKIAALGCAESLNNVVLALMLIVLTSLLASIGAFRGSQRAAAGAVTQ